MQRLQTCAPSMQLTGTRGATAPPFPSRAGYPLFLCAADLKQSFFVGDAAGRAGDFADSDK